MPKIDELIKKYEKEKELFEYLNSEFFAQSVESSDIITDLLKQDMDSLQDQIKRSGRISCFGIFNACKTAVEDYMNERQNAENFLKSQGSAYGIPLNAPLNRPVYERLYEATATVNSMLSKVTNTFKRVKAFSFKKIEQLHAFISVCRAKVNDIFLDIRVSLMSMTLKLESALNNGLNTATKHMVTEPSHAIAKKLGENSVAKANIQNRIDILSNAYSQAYGINTLQEKMALLLPNLQKAGKAVNETVLTKVLHTVNDPLKSVNAMQRKLNEFRQSLIDRQTVLMEQKSDYRKEMSDTRTETQKVPDDELEIY